MSVATTQKRRGSCREPRGATRGANWCQESRVEPVNHAGAPEKPLVSAYESEEEVSPKAGVAGSNPAGGTHCYLRRYDVEREPPVPWERQHDRNVRYVFATLRPPAAAAGAMVYYCYYYIQTAAAAPLAVEVW